MTNHRLSRTFHLAVLLLLCITLSGCWTPKLAADTASIATPPLIPAPPAQEEVQAEAMPTVAVQAYADLLEWQDDRRYPPELKDAVSHAIELGVLKPTSFQERFEPEQTVTYGEFRQWALSYQTALYGYQALPTAKTLAEEQTESRHFSSNPKPDLTSPMSPEKLSILPEKLEMASKTFSVSNSLSREALCYLYFVLTHRENALRRLSASAIDAMIPAGTNAGPDESLAQFKDYSVISPWARPAVAVFYRDGQLQKLFGKNPNQLTIDDGFGPNQPVTRADAIVLLHWIYGSIAPNKPASAVPSNAFSSPMQPRADIHVPDNQDNPSALQPTIPPAPVDHFKLTEEKTPAGSRRTLQVNGPD